MKHDWISMIGAYIGFAIIAWLLYRNPDTWPLIAIGMATGVLCERVQEHT